MKRLTVIEAEYLAAKARLQAAQQEKLEATTGYLEARDALRQVLEDVWPSRCECGGQSGYNAYAYGQHETR